MADRITAVTMPRWGMVMTEGQVAGLLVPEGRPLKAGEALVEIVALYDGSARTEYFFARNLHLIGRTKEECRPLKIARSRCVDPLASDHLRAFAARHLDIAQIIFQLPFARNRSDLGRRIQRIADPQRRHRAGQPVNECVVNLAVDNQSR